MGEASRVTCGIQRCTDCCALAAGGSCLAARAVQKCNDLCVCVLCDVPGCDLLNHGVHVDLTDLLDAGIVVKIVDAKIAAENSENISHQQSDTVA